MGSVLCLLLSNLHLYALKHRGDENIHVEHLCEETCMLLISNSMEATKNIINADPTTSSGSSSSSKGDEAQKKRIKESVRQMETVRC